MLGKNAWKKTSSQSNYPHIQEIFWAAEVAKNMFWSVISLVLNQTPLNLKNPYTLVVIYILFHYLNKEIKEQNINSQKSWKLLDFVYVSDLTLLTAQYWKLNSELTS